MQRTFWLFDITSCLCFGKTHRRGALGLNLDSEDLEVTVIIAYIMEILPIIFAWRIIRIWSQVSHTLILVLFLFFLLVILGSYGSSLGKLLYTRTDYQYFDNLQCTFCAVFFSCISFLSTLRSVTYKESIERFGVGRGRAPMTWGRNVSKKVLFQAPGCRWAESKKGISRDGRERQSFINCQ